MLNSLKLNVSGASGLKCLECNAQNEAECEKRGIERTCQQAPGSNKITVLT